LQNVILQNGTELSSAPELFDLLSNTLAFRLTKKLQNQVHILAA